MVERRYYRVAEHIFSMATTETDIFYRLSNYEPFRIKCPLESDTLLFQLDLVVSPSPELNLQHVFTDTSEDDMPRIEIYRASSTTCQDVHLVNPWVFCVAMYKTSPSCCTMVISEDFSHAVMYVSTEEVRQIAFAINNATMLLYAFASAPLRTLEMHAAVVAKDGWGYLFLGKSGTGKSTHARQWLATFHQSWLLNDDNPILRMLPTEVEQDGKKVLRDELYVFGSPWSGKTPCYRTESMPVRSIIKLSQAPENQIQELTLPQAYAYMLSSASGLKIEPKMMDAIYASIVDMIQSIQMYHLNCLPNAEAAQLCYETASPK